ncbi:MAG: aminopeptidase P family protein [Gemmatimonadaceae bacterium]
MTHRSMLLAALAASGAALALVVATSEPATSETLAPPAAHAAQQAAADLQQEYRQRRQALAARLPDGVLLALGAPEPRHDYLPFFQEPSFYYLTGLREPGAALVMVKRGGAVTATMFVQPRIPAQEVWSGARLGAEAVARLMGTAARPVAELRSALDSLLRIGLPLHVVGDAGESPDDGADRLLTADEQFVESLRRRHRGLRVRVVNDVVSMMRGTKSATELAFIRQAVDITVRAHNEVLRALEPGMNEFELQALIEYTFRRNGAERPAFASIVGSGPNSTTLHYNANDRFIEPGDLVVMDVGASYKGYAADVTRTLPASGTFTTEQRAIYQLVRDAHAAAERQAKIGARATLMNDSASATLAAGLARLGLIESPAARYDCEAGGARRECPQLALYYMHGLGHGIGLEVHDPEQYYFTHTIRPGSAFTIEPGVYVRANVLDVLPDTPRNRALAARLRPAVERYKNVGVRIEDDYVVTERGVEWISRAPREIAEIEQLMRGPYAGPAARDRALVETYRRAVP